MNVAAVKKIKQGDKVMKAGFELANNIIKPNIVFVDDHNRFVKYLSRGK